MGDAHITLVEDTHGKYHTRPQKEMKTFQNISDTQWVGVHWTGSEWDALSGFCEDGNKP